MFRTELHPAALPRSIALHDYILTVGSCFSEGIGRQLADYKFNVLANPFGTVYNPLSIHQLVYQMVENQSPADDGYLQRDDVFLHYDYPSRFAALSRSELSQSLTSAIAASHRFMTKTRWLMLTYGTAWVYRLRQNNRLVANCHKMPSSLFTKELLTEKQIVDSFNNLFEKLKATCPDPQVILTVSPVRHLRDTLELNSVSKAVLRLACHTLCQTHEAVHYFPAYELLLDDLRDYRFYDADLLHPSAEATDYIWNKFVQSAMDEEARKFIQEWHNIKQALNHKPFLPRSRSYRQFIEATLKRLEQLKHRVDVSAEIQNLQNQLKS